ncbi:MAG: hypothetical protein J4G04_08360 [Nitrosopumilaceae archaeon]|nr:hypothetical protein [Nitrosopumilaceae archaeon]
MIVTLASVTVIASIALDVSEDPSIEGIRAGVIHDREIPDSYIINRTGETWVSHYGSQELANERIELTRNTLSSGAESRVGQLSDRMSMREINFVTLTENPEIGLDEVAALQIQYNRLVGIHMAPDDEPLRRYEAYILKTYDVPQTPKEVNDRLVELTGDMAVFTQDIANTRYLWAARGIVPPELDMQDAPYWLAVGDLFDCEYNGEDDCDEERGYLENEGWRE